MRNNAKLCYNYASHDFLIQRKDALNYGVVRFPYFFPCPLFSILSEDWLRHVTFTFLIILITSNRD